MRSLRASTRPPRRRTSQRRERLAAPAERVRAGHQPASSESCSAPTRRERAAVQRAGPVARAAHRGAAAWSSRRARRSRRRDRSSCSRRMRRSRVTLATIEAAAIAALVPSPPMMRPVLALERHAEAVGQQQRARRRVEPVQRARERREIGAVHAAAVDLARRRDDHAHARRAGEHGVVQLLALRERARLGVVELCERRAHAALQAAVVEEHARRDERARRALRAPPRRCRRRTARRARGRGGAGGDRAGGACALGAVGRRRPCRPSVARPPPAARTACAHPSHARADRAQKKRMRSGGQARPNARPSSWLRGTGPQMRESSESLRLSPITK